MQSPNRHCISIQGTGFPSTGKIIQGIRFFILIFKCIMFLILIIRSAHKIAAFIMIQLQESVSTIINPLHFGTFSQAIRWRLKSPLYSIRIEIEISIKCCALKNGFYHSYGDLEHILLLFVDDLSIKGAVFTCAK